MRRAIQILAWAALMTTLLVTVAAATEKVVDRINGLGMIDYSRKADFKVGDYVRYRMTGSSQMGMRDDYVVTVVIAGEEEWWGDPCFWIETWTDAPGRPPETIATLIAYSIFSDTLAIQHMQLYQRKTCSGVNDDGTPKYEIPRAAASTLKSRTLFKRPIMWNVDTVGVDTVETPKGTFQATKVLIRQGTGVTSSQGDSSMYNEARENRTSFYTSQIPITHLVREDVESIIARKTWMIGRSTEGAPMRTRERGVGVARLIDYGHGLKPRLLPESISITLAESHAKNAKALAAEEGRAPAATARPAARKGAAKR